MSSAKWLRGFIVEFVSSHSKKATAKRRLSRQRLTQPGLATGTFRMEALEGRQLLSAFTPGDIVVVQVGANGATTTVGDNGTAVFLNEYTPSGVLVQQVAMPVTASGSNKAFVLGNNSSEGLLNLSTDGQELLLAGYDATVGSATVANGYPSAGVDNGTTTNDPREIGVVYASGAVDTSTAITAGDGISGANVREAAGSVAGGFYIAGQAKTPAAGGVAYVSALGGNTGTDLIGSGTNYGGQNLTNARGVQIFNGQVYLAQNKDTAEPLILALDGTTSGTLQEPTAAFNAATNPTSALPLPVPGTAVPNLTTPGSSSKTGNFFFAKLGASADFNINGTDSGYNTLYVADANTGATNSTPGITKYSWTGSAWVSNGTIGSASLSFSGLTGSVSGSTVTLYATVVNPTTANDVVSITDNSGFNHAITNNGSSTPTTISGTVIPSADVGEVYRGIAFAPTPSALGISGLMSASITSGNGATNISGGNAAFADTLTSSQLSTSTLSVAITANGDNANDILGITNQGTSAGQIGASGGNVTYTYPGGSATTIGTYTGGSSGTSLVITFNGNATAAAIQALINQINFQTASNSTATRTVNFTFTPSTGNGSAVSASESVNVALFTPTINAGSAITLGENHAAYTTGLSGIGDGESDSNANVTSVVASVTGGSSSIFASGPTVTGYSSAAGTATLGFTLASNLTGVGSATITVTVTNSLNNTATAVYTVTVNAITVTSTGVQVLAGKSSIITATALTTKETGVAAANIQYTLTSNPPASAGTIDKSGVPLVQNSTFTQADINNGLISYVSTGSTSTTDSVAFSIADLTNGGALTGQTFSVSVISGIIAEWNFPATASAPDNSPAPNLGSGTATSLGMTNSYNGASTTSDDVLETSGTANTGFGENLWRIRGTGGTNVNGWALAAPQYSQGVELDTSTVGYSNIVFSFDWYSTTQGIRDLQVQYNTGSGWVNYQGPSPTGTFVTGGNDYYNASLSPVNPTIHIDLSGIAAANNDPDLGIRLVSAYDSTGNLGNVYASAASNAASTIPYNNSSGNWRFGNLTFAAGITTATTIAANPPVGQNPGQNVTFTATVTPASGSQYPSGTVAFYDGVNQLGATQTVTQSGTSGTASITLNNLSAGVHGDITAQYTPTSGNGFIASGSSMNLFAGDPSDNPISYTINAPQATGVDVSPIVGQAFTGVVATFSDGTFTDPTGFSASINWGDGNTSNGTIVFTGTRNETNINGQTVAVNLFTVTGTNTYAAAGTDAMSITVTDPNNNTATVTPTARVAYAPLVVTGVATINTAYGMSLSNQTVATFTDPGLVANLAALGISDPTTQFSASINWGDASSADTGTISYDAGSHIFSVTGSHAYSQAGSYSVSVAVTPLTVSVERIDSSDPTNQNLVGDENGNTLTDSPSADFIDQYAIGASNQAGSLYTFSLPTVATNGGNEALTNSSYSVSEGELTLSTNGQYLVTGGYNATVSAWTPQQTFSSATTINRVIGTISGAGVIDTTTALTDAYSGDNFRGVVSTDGTQFWTSGHSSGFNPPNDYVRYATSGPNPSIGITDDSETPYNPENVNTVEIMNGQLYAGVRSVGATAPAGIYQIGTGLPTSGPQAETLFIQVPQSNPLDIGASSKPMSPFDFYMADLPNNPNTINGVNVAYVADGEMGITRYDYNGANWQFSYYIDSTGTVKDADYTVDPNGNITATGSFDSANASNDDIDSSKAGGVKGITGRIVNGQVQLFAVTAFGVTGQPNPGEKLIEVTDPFAGNGGTASYTTLASDSGASELTSVAFSPTQTVTSSTQVNKLGQAINFTAPISPIYFYPSETVNLAATGGASGNPVVFTLDASSTGAGSINGNVLTITGAGNFVIDANQAGNTNYNDASQVQQTQVVLLSSPGYYVPAPNSTSETPAPAGSYVPTSGATSATLAAPGYFVASAGQSTETIAPAGSYATGPGATSALLADPGYFVASAGQSTETIAPAGSYAPGPGAISAMLAAPGYFVASAGQSTETIAPAGSYATGPGATSALLAAPGYFVASAGQSTETIAPAGSYATGPGATSATLAAPGYFVASAGQSTETIAPAGSYATGPGATTATLAAPGYFVASAGQSAETIAPAGSYATGPGATSATLATPGHFVATAGQSQQTAAPAGYYVPGSGATSAIPADPGHYVPNAGSSTETLSPAGYYVPTSAATAPTIDPPGTTSPAGAVLPTPIISLNPINISFGTALANTQLTGTVVVPGKFTFTSAAGMVLPLGNGQIEAVTFTPTDTAHYTIATGTVIVNVVAAKTTVSVTSNFPGGAAPGQSVTFTATVAPVAPSTGTPTGKVQFYIDTVAYGPPVTVTGGTAAISDSALTPGNHAITATYTSSTTNFTGSSTATAFTQSIGKFTATLSNLAAPTIILNTPLVTLGGQITGAPSTAKPTGTVKIAIFLGGVQLTSQTVSLTSSGSFSATFLSLFAKVGQYTLVYSYSGDANYAASSSTVLGAITYVVEPSSTPKAKAGTTVAINLELEDVFDLDFSSASTTVTATGIALASNPNAITSLPPGNTPTFTYSKGAYSLNLKTTGLAAGTYVLYFTIAGDPVTHSVQFILT